MKNHKLRGKTINLFLSFLIIFLLIFLLDISCASTMGSADVVFSHMADSCYSVDVYSNSTDISVMLVNNEDVTNYTIEWKDNMTNIIELPPGSMAVKLPYNRVGIKLPDGNTSVLPKGSTFIDVSKGDVSVFHISDTAINVYNQSTIIGVSKVISFPIENFTAGAVFTQSVHTLDSYEVKAVFTELNNPDLSDNIVDYSVDWGDDIKETYEATKITTSHTYKRSGVYLQTFKVTDSFGITYIFMQNYTVKYEGHLLHTYLWVKEYKEPVAATASTGIGTTLAGLIIFTETGKYKFLALLSFLIPLYTHIQKEDVLDQFVRGQIYGFVKTNPGVHYHEIMKKLDMKNGTLSYHLKVLEKTEMIKSRREGLRYRAFYPVGMKFPEEERYRLTELQINILKIIKEHRGISQKEIAKILNEKPQVINYNIKVLRQAELINMRKHGRKTSCYPKDKPADTEGFG